mmetsp:Transcript_32743/g.49343  ORF Transcript_32743/g.49343 Transcript_32743/m.49343 type:complete len:644 (+) Transcript_32743:149-2080(+)
MQLSSFNYYFALFSFVVVADWVDPDTPSSAYTTESYVPRVPNLPPTPASTNKPHRRHHFDDDDAVSRSPSASPSLSPSEMPSTYPTSTPTQSYKEFKIVFSDEFNTPGRSFADGNDPRWTALDKNDYTNDALHYYSPDNIRTGDEGKLVIKSEATDTDVIGFDDVKRKKTHVTKHFRSAMVQSWNKFCFTGGIMEAEVTLPGKHNVGGLWPAFWLLGNMARHTYVGSSEHIWPWSSTMCTAKSRNSQLISGCANSVHYGMEKRLGRGAPEIDVFEVQPGPIKANEGVFLYSSVGQPFMSASFQVAPGRPSNRPGPGAWPGPGQWYEGLKSGNNASLNINFYGNYNHFRGDFNPAISDYWSDAISYNRQLNASYFKNPHVYRLEWDVPTNETDGYLRWYLDGELVLGIDGTGVVAAGLGSEISSEPMYILLNTAISKQWGFPKKCPDNCPCEKYDCNSAEWTETCGFSEGFCEMMKSKPEYEINWVRVYQDPTNEHQKVGCSTPERPTRQFIEAHEKLYKTVDDLHPLKGIQRGRGTCNPLLENESSKDACGGSERGRCTAGRVCECNAGWTGPHCLAHAGSDPIRYDQPDKISDLGFILPAVTPAVLVIGICILVAMITGGVLWRKRFDGWSAIPDGAPLYKK